MATIRVDYTPNKKQAIFHRSGETEVVYGGAKGGGKTAALVMETLAYALENAGATCYMFRETYDDLEANLIHEWKTKVPQELYEYHESKHIVTLKNGSRVYFRYVRSYDDARKYQGRSIDYIAIDELTKYDERSVQELLSCLRSPRGFPPRFRATCNPGDVGHLWVKRRYIDATNYGASKTLDDVTGNSIAFIPALVYDNDVLMRNDPAYVKRLENLPDEQKKAYLYGDWDVFAGQYFKEWRRELHVIQPFAIPSHWYRYRSIDWGYADWCATYWHTVSPEGRKYTYRELYINQTHASDVARRIRELSQGEDVRYTVASPDMWQNRGNDVIAGENLADTFAANGVFLSKADNSRILGWNRMRENLSLAGDGKPHWQIFETCENLIRTLPALIHDERRVEDVSDKVEDHGAESCRYFLMSRPSPTEGDITRDKFVGNNFDREYRDYDDDDDGAGKITFFS